jgi:kynurenine 3-monooxygenase
LITIVGAGPAGCLLGILLARRGMRVEIYERRPDPATTRTPAGRSINLALAARGIRALEAAGVMRTLRAELVTMRGRMLHEIGKDDQFNAYGQRAHEVIWSVSRSRLTALLTQAARALPGLTMHFEQQCSGYSGDGELRMRDLRSHRDYSLRGERIVGADGAGSQLRHDLAARDGFTVTEARLPHDYKELTVAARGGVPQLSMDALHIWPRGGHMLIALPNADGSFTATLFLARHGSGDSQLGFDALQTTEAVHEFFARHFPDVVPLVSDLAEQFLTHPQGMLGTVYCPQWHETERLLLLGDAAHAIVPFHGQGMNCAFEDCRILDELLAATPVDAFSRFAAARRDDCLAIAQMALENYGEMRDAVRDPLFQRQKALALQLEREFPDRFIPRYSMVMFRDDIPYSTALQRGRIQQQILDELTAGTGAAAADLINVRLPPVFAQAQ